MHSVLSISTHTGEKLSVPKALVPQRVKPGAALARQNKEPYRGRHRKADKRTSCTFFKETEDRRGDSTVDVSKNPFEPAPIENKYKCTDIIFFGSYLR
jgi:hypothetical protein